MNIDELDRNVTFIEDHPELHNQAVWTCGTGACLAGHIVLNNGYTLYLRDGDDLGARVLNPQGEAVIVSREARRILGASREETNLLFYSTNTVKTLREMTKDLQNGEEITQNWRFVRYLVEEKGTYMIRSVVERKPGL